MDLVLGGWQVTGIHVLQSGLALTATLGGANVLNLGGERRARPNLVGDPELPESRAHAVDAGSTPTRSPRSVRSPQAFGNAGVGIMRGPGVANFDFTFAKNFQRRRPAVASSSATEVFNAFNHPNFGPPNIASASRAASARFSSAAHARIIQFGLKFYF